MLRKVQVVEGQWAVLADGGFSEEAEAGRPEAILPGGDGAGAVTNHVDALSDLFP